MKKVNRITVRKKVDADKYVNVETGEFLSSFVDNLTSETDTSFVRMDYADYVVVDRKVLNFLKDREIEFVPPPYIKAISLLSSLSLMVTCFQLFLCTR